MSSTYKDAAAEIAVLREALRQVEGIARELDMCDPSPVGVTTDWKHILKIAQEALDRNHTEPIYGSPDCRCKECTKFRSEYGNVFTPHEQEVIASRFKDNKTISELRVQLAQCRAANVIVLGKEVITRIALDRARAEGAEEERDGRTVNQSG